VDQGVARKAQQEPEGEMEGTETAAAAERKAALAQAVKRKVNDACGDGRLADRAKANGEVLQ
jgi:hypothetical protein